jgi:UDP-N-acetylglucosamine--N-acetylmuramyl-(pentapeptide) pyrophosphoryl-undecaprenol N-acetylglucosamine transferase
VSSPPTIVLAASAGGHIHELRVLARRFVPAGANTLWLTFDTAQTRSLLAGEDVVWLRPAGPRDWRSTLANVAPVARLLRRYRPLASVSTGAAIALPVLALSQLLGIEAHYLESAARTEGPSLTARLLAPVPGLHRYTQHPGWAGGRWSFAGSVIDGYGAEAVAPPKIRRVVVTLGTQGDFPFPRLVEAVRPLLPTDVEVLWQLGSTPAPSGLGGRSLVPYAELSAAMAEADLVIGHGGVGTVLAALDAGRRPVIVPRRQAHGEHVDDHQAVFARTLGSLAVVSQPEDLTVDHLHAAAAQRIVPRSGAPLRLAGRLGTLSAAQS